MTIMQARCAVRHQTFVLSQTHDPVPTRPAAGRKVETFAAYFIKENCLKHEHSTNVRRSLLRRQRESPIQLCGVPCRAVVAGSLVGSKIISRNAPRKRHDCRPAQVNLLNIHANDRFRSKPNPMTIQNHSNGAHRCVSRAAF